jgi:hypothetical protein
LWITTDATVCDGRPARWRPLCHKSNSERVLLHRTTILTPQRRKCASRSNTVWGLTVRIARPGLLGTPGLAFLVTASAGGRVLQAASGCADGVTCAGASPLTLPVPAGVVFLFQALQHFRKAHHGILLSLALVGGVGAT